MGKEEQAEEREVLNSIFPDEIQGMPTAVHLVLLKAMAVLSSFLTHGQIYQILNIGYRFFWTS